LGSKSTYDREVILNHFGGGVDHDTTPGDLPSCHCDRTGEENRINLVAGAVSMGW